MEAALALCSLLVVVLAAVGSLAAVAASIRCVDAARELARMTARGEPERGHQIAALLAPTDAAIHVAVTGGEVTVEISTTPLAPLPLRVGARAVAALEPGAAGVPAGAP